jgi:nucleoside phosphorylase
MATGAGQDLLVCFALPQEARPFRRLARRRRGVRVLVTGMGRHNAETALLGILHGWRPELVLTCGLAGALNPELDVNTVVYDAADALALAKPLAAAGALPAHLVCHDEIVNCSGPKAELRRRTGADAVEMESGRIREICQTAGIPCATVRVILDTAEEDLPVDFNQFLTAEKRLRCGKLGIELLKSPPLAVRLLALQRRTREAARRLARVLAQITLETGDHCCGSAQAVPGASGTV